MNQRFLKDIFRKNTDQEGLAGYLSTVAVETEASYKLALNHIADHLAIKRFAPWDIAYVRHQYNERLSRLGSYKYGDLLRILQNSLEMQGFSYDQFGVIVFKDRYIHDLSVVKRGQVHIHNCCDRNKIQTGQAVHFDSMDIVRVELNLWADGYETYRIAFHEIGHALHLRHIITQKYRSLRTAFPVFFSEGLALFQESYIYDTEWLTQHLGLGDNTVCEIRNHVAVLELLRLRENTLSALWELLIHESPGADVEALWKALALELLYPDADEIPVIGVDFRRISHYPLRTVDTVLSILVRDHIRNYLSVKLGGCYCNMAQQILPIYQLGGSKDWDEILLEVTGKRLNARHTAEFIGILMGRQPAGGQ